MASLTCFPRNVPCHRLMPYRAIKLARSYATQGSLGGASGRSSASPSHRKAITVTSDDGRYKWSDLSVKEKAARSTQQTLNFALVASGAVGTLLIAYFLYTELFAADSKTRQFNNAVDRVKTDSRCTDILGDSRKIKAYGEPTSNKWARARPLASSTTIDRQGIEHLRMHFNIEGPDNKGVVNLHMTKRSGQSELIYETLSLTVPGHSTIYLEDANEKPTKKTAYKLFGVNLR